MHAKYTTDTIRLGRRDGGPTSVNKRHVSHGHRLRFGVHQHLVPIVQDDRLVIGMPNLAADEHPRVASLDDPVQLSQLRLAADRTARIDAGVRPFGCCVLTYTVSPPSRNKLFDEVRLAAAASQRFVPQDQVLVQLELASNRHEEPFTLADEHFVATSIRLRGFTASLSLQPTNIRPA